MIRSFFLLGTLIFMAGCKSNTKNDHSHDYTIKDPYYYQQWYLDKNDTFYEKNNIKKDAHIHAKEILLHYTGRDIKIAVMDTDIDTEHEDLKNRITFVYELASENNKSENNLEAYHGTAVTGIIAARRNDKGILGIASSSEIFFLKLKNNMSDSETIELFRKAEALGVDIINCSWGTYDVSTPVKETIRDLAINGREGKGIIIVFASGNGNIDMGNDESAIAEVISVGSTNEENRRSWYSNYGKNLDIVAPGGQMYGIATLDISGEKGRGEIDEDYLLYDDYKPFKGTSAAAPIVSGIIALLMEKNPYLNRDTIDSMLKKSSDKIGAFEYVDGRNDYYGYGKINLLKLFSY